MFSVLLQQFNNLSVETQTIIWRQVLLTPQFIDFITNTKNLVQQQYFDLPEPETFELADMSKHYAGKRQLKAIIEVLDNLLAINNFMQQKTESIQSYNIKN